ncbi:MAG: twin-arginine translocation signal domain-containing protein [Phycisphaerales bacterium]|nr:MAG: twin-arginine translocation signal domain-containing protein [Phycisphaerales bacterium]
MAEMKDELTRRDFFKGAGLAAAGGAVALAGTQEDVGGTQKTSRAVLIRDEKAVSEAGVIDGERIQTMMDQAMTSLFGLEDPADCWKLIIKPDDIVGLKINVWRYLPTPKELVQVLRKGVMGAGVPAENIDESDRDVLKKDVFKRATALINSRPMRTHSWSGVGSLLKNYITFDNPPDYHDDSCADLAKLWELPVVKGKTRLNVLVMLTPQFHNLGPHHFDSKYTWPYKGLIVSTDPVAADAVGLRIIQAKRREVFGEDRPLQPTAHHIQRADTVHKLGVADMEKIDLVRLGWKADALI